MEVDSEREVLSLAKNHQPVHIFSKSQILQNESSYKQSSRGKKKNQLIAKHIGAGGLTLGRYDVKQ